MSDLFNKDELAVFDSMEELLELIPYYLANEDKRTEIAKKAQTKVLAEHTYQHRMQTLIDFIAQKKTGWPVKKNRYEQLAKDLPQELGNELAQMLDRLHMPQDAAFSDVIWAVRSQQGQLSDLETALLFLDEWQKLYMNK